MMRYLRRNQVFFFMLVILIFGIGISIFSMYELHSLKLEHEWHHHDQQLGMMKRLPGHESKAVMGGNLAATSSSSSSGYKPTVWIQAGKNSKSANNARNSYLKHVFLVFETMGFSTTGSEHSDWTTMWAHDYPFVTFSGAMKKLKPYQRVNHYPGSGYITNKVTLAQTNFDFIPKAFEMPAKKQEFLTFSEQHKDMSWVQKSNMHRGIEVKDRHSLDLSKKGSFIQQFVSNPFLIDGHKFDIGVYTIITGLDPLRVYVIDGDALFRFCPEIYYPFDDSIQDKYVVGDDYLPMWKVQSLKSLMNDHDFTFKNTFNEHMRSSGINPNLIWDKIYSAIRQVVLAKENNILNSAKSYPSKRNFFEMMRFDFVLDDKLNAFLMEANMSPNLSSDHFPQNARLYNHVIFNLLGLVGVDHFMAGVHRKRTAPHEDSVLVASSDIRVFPDLCATPVCVAGCQELMQCKLCKRCLTKELETDIKIAYLEHRQRGSSRRVFPPTLTQASALKWSPSSSSKLFDNLSENNKLIYLWFIGKCRLDSSWC